MNPVPIQFRSPDKFVGFSFYTYIPSRNELYVGYSQSCKSVITSPVTVDIRRRDMRLLRRQLEDLGVKVVDVNSCEYEFLANLTREIWGEA